MRNKIPLKAFNLLITVLLFSACHKHDNPGPSPATSNVDVYVVGGDSNGAKLWKNGTAISLAAENNLGNFASDIFISGNDIYISGYENVGNSVYVAQYWKNGVAVRLTDGTHNAYAESITVQGNDVYVAGREQSPGRATYVAKYWKNGIAVPLSDVNENASLAGIAIVGTNVCAVGMHNKDGHPSVACYWKNGQLTNLSDETTTAEQQAISVSGSNIYLMWSVSYNDQGFSRTSYSINFGTPSILTDAAKNFLGYGITATGNDVYVAGFGISTDRNVLTAAYFKNGNPIAVTNGPKSDYATSIATSGNDVYVAGWTENVANGKYPTACYWKNNTKILLGDGLSQSTASRILVIKK